MIGALVTIALVGFLLWLIITYVPMPAQFKQIMVPAVIVLMLLWLFSPYIGFGDFGSPLHR